MHFLRLEGSEDPATFTIEIELINASDAPMEFEPSPHPFTMMVG